MTSDDTDDDDDDDDGAMCENIKFTTKICLDLPHFVFHFSF